MTDVYLSYAIVEAYLIIFSIAIFVHLNANLGTEYEVKMLRRIIYSFWIMLVTDIFWAHVEGGVFLPHDLLNAAVNGISIAAVAAGCYYWYRFVEYRLGSRKHVDGKRVDAMRVLVWAIIAFDLISVFTGWVFYIDGKGHYVMGPLFWIQASGTYIFLIIPTIKSLHRVAKAHDRFERREYVIYALYMLPPLVAGIIEDLVKGAPILYLNMFMNIHILFLALQDAQVFHDALTGINNRRRLDQYLAAKVQKATKRNPLYAFMIDVNKFKDINDTYGHVEGDRVLQMVADALKKSAVKYHGFIARYGGDEFSYVLMGSKYDPPEVVESIHAAIRQEIEDKGSHRYRVTVSVGWSKCTDETEAVPTLIKRADEKLYEDKKRNR